MKKVLVSIIFLLSISAMGMAQDTDKMKQPDLQTSEPDFFDPTRDAKKKQEYHFGVEYRLEAGYVQQNQRSLRKNYPDMFLHGGHVGVTFDFLLPYRFSAQAGVLYTLTYGTYNQSWAAMGYEDIYAHSAYMHHRIMEHQLTVPLRVYYNIHLWKELNMFLYAGPQLNIGLAAKDNLSANVTDSTIHWMSGGAVSIPGGTTTIAVTQRTEPYDRYTEKELWRANIQMGVGGGFEWGPYRLQAGYDFGLNNQVRQRIAPKQHMWEWSWYVSFCYKFKSTQKSSPGHSVP